MARAIGGSIDRVVPLAVRESMGMVGCAVGQRHGMSLVWFPCRLHSGRGRGQRPVFAQQFRAKPTLVTEFRAADIAFARMQVWTNCRACALADSDLLAEPTNKVGTTSRRMPCPQHRLSRRP